MPLQIYMPESGLSLAELTDNVNDELKRSGRCLVVVSEGLDVGEHGAKAYPDFITHENRPHGIPSPVGAASSAVAVPARIETA